MDTINDHSIFHNYQNDKLLVVDNKFIQASPSNNLKTKRTRTHLLYQCGLPIKQSQFQPTTDLHTQKPLCRQQALSPYGPYKQVLTLLKSFTLLHQSLVLLESMKESKHLHSTIWTRLLPKPFYERNKIFGFSLPQKT